MSQNQNQTQPTQPTQPATPAVTSPSGAPVDTVAGTAPGKTVVGNPRDIQGLLALIVVLGAFAMAGIAIFLQPANVTTVLSSILPLAAVVTGYYFGQQSQKT